MRDDESFEIERALDLIPYVIGASWATTWFRLNKIRNPSRGEYRSKVAEYVKFLENLIDSFPKSDNFQEITSFTKKKYKEEIEKILAGKNPEVEKRLDRYMDYG